MSETIWIINQCSSTLDTGFGGRHYYLSRELAKIGYNVHLFSASDHHLLREKPKLNSLFKEERIHGFTYVWIKVLGYEYAQSKRRVLSEIDFCLKISRLSSKYKSNPPDIIIYSSPSLIPFLGAWALSKKFSARLMLDIRDLWPLTLINMGVSRLHPYVLLLSLVERFAYKRVEKIISNWPYAIKYIEKLGCSNDMFTWIPNGYSADEFDRPEKAEVKSYVDLVGPHDFIVGYAGTVGLVNALDTFLDAAELLSGYANIKFVIVGSGSQKKNLVDRAVSSDMSNVVFLDQVPKKQISSVLGLFDVCYVGFLDIDLYQYGSSLTKLPEYLASARPIIYASSSPFQPIREYSAGLTVRAEDASGVADAILTLYRMSENDRNVLGQNGRIAALENYEYSILAKRLAERVFK